VPNLGKTSQRTGDGMGKGAGFVIILTRIDKRFHYGRISLWL
jgi:hypothetical protein